MSEVDSKGVFRLSNGHFGYRFVVTVNGKKKSEKRVKDENGNPYRTEKQAQKARMKAMKLKKMEEEQKTEEGGNQRKTVQAVYEEYCKNGRRGKAAATIRKQDSLWKNHFSKKFGKRYVDEITLAEIQDFLEEAYFTEERAYSYVESFLKMFYLIFGQAYSRGYMEVELYNKLCKNKDTKIHMPKRKVNDDDCIVFFEENKICQLDDYFKGTNAETAYMLGKYCGLRINE